MEVQKMLQSTEADTSATYIYEIIEFLTGTAN